MGRTVCVCNPFAMVLWLCVIARCVGMMENAILFMCTGRSPADADICFEFVPFDEACA